MRLRVNLLLMLLTTARLAEGDAPRSVPIRRTGFVPDAVTAIAIAEAILSPIYGKATIESERPLTATLSKGIWTVTGTLCEGCDGGVALIEISKANAKIIRVSHGK